jgi:hypothetical protein
MAADSSGRTSGLTNHQVRRLPIREGPGLLLRCDRRSEQQPGCRGRSGDDAEAYAIWVQQALATRIDPHRPAIGKRGRPLLSHPVNWRLASRVERWLLRGPRAYTKPSSRLAALHGRAGRGLFRGSMHGWRAAHLRIGRAWESESDRPVDTGVVGATKREACAARNPPRSRAIIHDTTDR